MKNILFLLSILLGQTMYGQTQRLGDALNHLVDPLDKTQINSGYLWDKGTNGFGEPAIFDGCSMTPPICSRSPSASCTSRPAIVLSATEQICCPTRLCT